MKLSQRPVHIQEGGSPSRSCLLSQPVWAPNQVRKRGVRERKWPSSLHLCPASSTAALLRRTVPVVFSTLTAAAAQPLPPSTQMLRASTTNSLDSTPFQDPDPLSPPRTTLFPTLSPDCSPPVSVLPVPLIPQTAPVLAPHGLLPPSHPDQLCHWRHQ